MVCGPVAVICGPAALARDSQDAAHSFLVLWRTSAGTSGVELDPGVLCSVISEHDFQRSVHVHVVLAHQGEPVELTDVQN